MNFQIDLDQLMSLADVELDAWTNSNVVDCALSELADGITLEWGMKLIPQDDTGIVVEYDNQWIPPGSIVKFDLDYYHHESSLQEWDEYGIQTYEVEGTLTIH